MIEPGFSFRSLACVSEGWIARALELAYEPYLSMNPSVAAQSRSDCSAFDTLVHEQPDSVGTCGFVTVLGDLLTGFVSWDPRGRPDAVILGHNIVLPDYQNRGFGTRQLRHAIGNMPSVRRICVTTGDHPFFLPAQAMYLACGFRETRRGKAKTAAGFKIIEYELELS